MKGLCYRTPLTYARLDEVEWYDYRLQRKLICQKLLPTTVFNMRYKLFDAISQSDWPDLQADVEDWSGS